MKPAQNHQALQQQLQISSKENDLAIVNSAKINNSKPPHVLTNKTINSRQKIQQRMKDLEGVVSQREYNEEKTQSHERRLTGNSIKRSAMNGHSSSSTLMGLQERIAKSQTRPVSREASLGINGTNLLSTRGQVYAVKDPSSALVFFANSSTGIGGDNSQLAVNGTAPKRTSHNQLISKAQLTTQQVAQANRAAAKQLQNTIAHDTQNQNVIMVKQSADFDAWRTQSIISSTLRPVNNPQFASTISNTIQSPQSRSLVRPSTSHHPREPQLHTIHSSPQRGASNNKIAEDELVSSSKKALKRDERKQQANLPLHLRHTANSKGKTAQKKSPEKKMSQVCVIPGAQESDSQTQKDKQLNRITTEPHPISKLTTAGNGQMRSQSAHPSKALLQMKIVEFHGEKNQKPSGPNNRENLFSMGSSTDISSRNNLLNFASATTDQRENAFLTGDMISSNGVLLPYFNSVMRNNKLQIPSIIQFGEQIIHQPYIQPSDSGNPDFDQGNTENKDQKLVMLNERTGSVQLLVPYQSYLLGTSNRNNSTSALETRSLMQPSSTNIASERIHSWQQRPFSSKVQQQKPSQKPCSKTTHSHNLECISDEETDEVGAQYQRKSKFASTLRNDIELSRAQSQDFFATQQQPLYYQGASTHIPSKNKSNAVDVKQEDPGELTREQIFNYLHSKRDGSQHRLYGLIQREKGLLDEIQMKQELLKREINVRPGSSPTIHSPFDTRATSPGLNRNPSAFRDFNYINIFMQPPPSLTMQPSSGLGGTTTNASATPALIPMPQQSVASEYDLASLFNHETHYFQEQLTSLIRQTPLQTFLQEAQESEKVFTPFNYVPPQSKRFLADPASFDVNTGKSSAALQKKGEDIGFEEHTTIKENQSRTHARLLNQLLTDILSGGKYSDQDWFNLGAAAGTTTNRNNFGIQDGQANTGKEVCFGTTLKGQLQRYIEGKDLAKIFREKMFPQDCLTTKSRRIFAYEAPLNNDQQPLMIKQEPSLMDEGIQQEDNQLLLKLLIEASSAHQEKPMLTQHFAGAAADDARILDAQPLKDFSQVVKAKASEPNKTDNVAEGIFETKVRFDDQLIDTFVKRDQGKNKNEQQAIDPKDKKEAEALDALTKVETRHMRLTNQRAKEFYNDTKARNEKELQRIMKLIDANLQFPPNKRGGGKVASTSNVVEPTFMPLADIAGTPMQQGIDVNDDLYRRETRQRSMIYMCFLEMVRQTCIKQKDQGLLLLKIWHAYFDQYDGEIDRLVQSIRVKQREFDSILDSMRAAFADIVGQKEKTEQKFFELTQRIEELQKDLNVSRLIQKRDGELRKEAQDNFKKMKMIFPRCEEYLEVIHLKFTDPARTGLERLKYLCKKLKRNMPTAKGELPLIQDLDQIMASIVAEPVHCLNVRLENIQLLEQMDQVKADNVARFGYLEALLLEREAELRDFEERRAFAEEKECQTDLQLKDIKNMLRGGLMQVKKESTMKLNQTETKSNRGSNNDLGFLSALKGGTNNENQSDNYLSVPGHHQKQLFAQTSNLSVQSDNQSVNSGVSYTQNNRQPLPPKKNTISSMVSSIHKKAAESRLSTTSALTVNIGGLLQQTAPQTETKSQQLFLRQKTRASRVVEQEDDITGELNRKKVDRNPHLTVVTNRNLQQKIGQHLSQKMNGGKSPGGVRSPGQVVGLSPGLKSKKTIMMDRSPGFQRKQTVAGKGSNQSKAPLNKASNASQNQGGAELQPQQKVWNDPNNQVILENDSEVDSFGSDKDDDASSPTKKPEININNVEASINQQTPPVLNGDSYNSRNTPLLDNNTDDKLRTVQQLAPNSQSPEQQQQQLLGKTSPRKFHSENKIDITGLHQDTFIPAIVINTIKEDDYRTQSSGTAGSHVEFIKDLGHNHQRTRQLQQIHMHTESSVDSAGQPYVMTTPNKEVVDLNYSLSNNKQGADGQSDKSSSGIFQKQQQLLMNSSASPTFKPPSNHPSSTKRQYLSIDFQIEDIDTLIEEQKQNSPHPGEPKSPLPWISKK